MVAGRKGWSRRGLLAGMAGVLCAGPVVRAAADVPPQTRFAFDVYAGSRRVGRHTVDFALHPEGGFEALTRIEVRVSLVFLTLYRVHHEVREWWREGMVRAFTVRAEEGHRRREIVGEPHGAGIRVRGPRGERQVPLGIMTDVAFWNPAIVRQPLLLDTWKGDLVGVEGRGGTVERIRLDGREVEAVRYELDTESGRAATVWYDRAGRWVRGRVRIGKVVLDYLPAA